MPETEEVMFYAHYDSIFRVREDYDTESSSSHIEMHHLAETEDFASAFYEYKLKYEVLENVVKNLWATHEYSQEYISFLLGAYSEEEFQTVARRFAVQQQVCNNPGYITFASNLVSNTLNQNLTTSDLSLLLNVEIDCINNTPLIENFQADDEIEQ